ncbi:hypothetical protein ACFFRR_008844 [Megaselia abdita]
MFKVNVNDYQLHYKIDRANSKLDMILNILGETYPDLKPELIVKHSFKSRKDLEVYGILLPLDNLNSTNYVEENLNTKGEFYELMEAVLMNCCQRRQKTYNNLNSIMNELFDPIFLSGFTFYGTSVKPAFSINYKNIIQVIGRAILSYDPRLTTEETLKHFKHYFKHLNQRAQRKKDAAQKKTMPL